MIFILFRYDDGKRQEPPVKSEKSAHKQQLHLLPSQQHQRQNERPSYQLSLQHQSHHEDSSVDTTQHLKTKVDRPETTYRSYMELLKGGVSSHGVEGGGEREGVKREISTDTKEEKKISFDDYHSSLLRDLYSENMFADYNIESDMKPSYPSTSSHIMPTTVDYPEHSFNNYEYVNYDSVIEQQLQ